MAVIDGHPVAPSTQLFAGRQPRGPGADDADGLSEFGARLDRLDPTLFPGGVGDIALDGADGDGAVARLLDDAIALAESVLRTDPPADLGEIVGGGGDLVGLFEPTFGGQLKPIRNVVVNRAVDLAEGHAALGAAPGLGGRLALVEAGVNLSKIPAASRGGNGPAISRSRRLPPATYSIA